MKPAVKNQAGTLTPNGGATHAVSSDHGDQRLEQLRRGQTQAATKRATSTEIPMTSGAAACAAERTPKTDQQAHECSPAEADTSRDHKRNPARTARWFPDRRGQGRDEAHPTSSNPKREPAEPKPTSRPADTYVRNQSQ